jgi:hypothetical protein
MRPLRPAFPLPRLRGVRLALALALATAAAGAATPIRHVLLVSIDGLRWQEVFAGAEEKFINKDDGGVPNNQLEPLRRDFLAATAAERRTKLMPFFWGTVARQGQIYGNRDLGSVAAVLNAQRVSYPGYNEMLTGRVDPVITSNTPILNPNVTVLEWLHGRPGFAGRVGVAAQWGVFHAIYNVPRSRLPVWLSDRRQPESLLSPRLREIDAWMADIPPVAAGEHFDAFVYEATLDLYARLQPRVFHVAFGEPDSWAHARRYDRYLYSIQRVDRFVRQLWERLQALPDYRDSTALILTPDHGRGVLGSDWTSHGAKIPRADESWLAALGPGIRPLGERRDVPPVHQAQIAATVAALLGEDFLAAFPAAAPPVADVVGPRVP